MKKHEALSVGEIIERALAAAGDPQILHRQRVCYLWGEVVGPSINRYTLRRHVEGDTLHVYLSSAVIKQELAYREASLVDTLNSLVGAQVLRRISFH